MPKRIICRTSTPVFKSTAKKPKALSVRRKWLNSLGKRGLFDWDITIKHKSGNITSQTIPFDSLDDATAWAHDRCKPGHTIFIDGMQIVSK